MICTICGEDKQPYEFTQFTHMEASDKYFFVHIRRYSNGNARNDVCWVCNGGYRCVGCGNVKPAAEYRVQGRYCHACKSTWRRPAKHIVFATFKPTKTRTAQSAKGVGHGDAK